MTRRITLLVAAALLCATPVSLHRSHEGTLGLSLDRAAARIGRPFTPLSVAGVNRRVHRRAYRGYYGPGYYGRGYHGPGYYGRGYYGRGYYGRGYYGHRGWRH